jgi:RNA polymerase sigma-70 factor (ECF subfamily)
MKGSNIESFDKFDHKAFETLFKEYYPFLCSFAKKYVADVDSCKDIVHNVFLNLWNKKDVLHTETSLKSYLFKSTHNRCLNHIRDSKKIIHHDVLTDNSAIPAYIESTDYLEQSELEIRIKNSIDGLPEKCRQVFMLSRFEEKKYSEIADQLGVSVKAVEAQMSKALKILREKLVDYLVVLWFLFSTMIG